MKLLLPLIFATLFLSCAAQPKHKDITLEGPAANAAFHEWSAALPAEFTYPVEYRFDMTFGIEGIEDLAGQELVFKIGADTSMVSAWEFRMQSKLSLEVMGQEIAVNIGAESNAEELRISLDNMEFLAMQTGMEPPSGLSISTDRVQKVWDAIMRLTEVSLETVDGFEDVGAFADGLKGVGDFVHPALNSRYLAMSPMLSAGRWQVEGEFAYVSFDINQDLFMEMLSDLASAELAIDMDAISQAADNMKMSTTFDVQDGKMTNMTVLASLSFKDDFGQELPMDIAITFDNSPLLEPVTPVEFSDPSTAMDLNTYFDDYWPMVESMMPMIESMMRQEMGDDAGAADEDFEF